MVASLTPCASPLATPRCRVVISRTQENITRHGCLLFSGSHSGRPFLSHSLKVPGADHFGEGKKVFDNLTVSLRNSSPEPLKEFPWERAKTLVLERLLFIGKNAIKWSFIIWFIATFVIDVSLAFSRNRELMIPVGLFVGVTVADFLKETAQEFFQNSTKDTSFIRNFMAVGSIFMLVKFISSVLNLQGQALLSHIGNGGLMQVLCWRGSRCSLKTMHE